MRTLIVLIVLCLPMPALAEVALDLYGGASINGQIDVDQTIAVPGGGGTGQINGLDTKTGFTGGVRGTVWFEGLPWLGVGVDAFYLEPSIERQTATGSITGPGGSASVTRQVNQINIDTFGASLDLRLRLPIDPSTDYPGGRIQPTVSIGPALLITRVEDTNNFTPPNQDATDTRLGLKVGAGITGMITPWLGAFIEYRYLYWKTQANLIDTTLGASFNNDLTIHNHAILAGLSFRFGQHASRQPM